MFWRLSWWRIDTSSVSFHHLVAAVGGLYNWETGDVWRLDLRVQRFSWSSQLVAAVGYHFLHPAFYLFVITFIFKFIFYYSTIDIPFFLKLISLYLINSTFKYSLIQLFIRFIWECPSNNYSKIGPFYLFVKFHLIFYLVSVHLSGISHHFINIMNFVELEIEFEWMKEEEKFRKKIYILFIFIEMFQILIELMDDPNTLSKKKTTFPRRESNPGRGGD